METVLAQEETHESQVLFNRALELINRSNFDTAMTHLEEALQIAPNNATYLSHYGLCVAVDREDYDSARKLCQRAIKMNPADPVNRVNLGRVLRLEGDMRLAYETFIRAWKQDKSHPAAASELSRMGIRRPPVLKFLARDNWINVQLGRLRATVQRAR